MLLGTVARNDPVFSEVHAVRNAVYDVREELREGLDEMNGRLDAVIDALSEAGIQVGGMRSVIPPREP